MLAYVDYNIFGRLLEARDGCVPESKDPRWGADHQALLELFGPQHHDNLRFAICREDAMEEFRAYCPEAIGNYADIADNLPAPMMRKWELFQGVEELPLKIAPYGEYGYGCGPYGGGDRDHYVVLRALREVLGIPDGATPQRDRDARHLLHAALHRCDAFLTMDYKSIVDRLQPLPAPLSDVLAARDLRLEVVTPSQLLEKLKRGRIIE
jgi:hypothetical protein